MKKIEIETMENLQGGIKWLACATAAVALGGALGVGLAAVSGNPLAIGLLSSPGGARTYVGIISGGIMAAGECVE